MDTLTHTLLGLAIGAARRRDNPPSLEPSPTDRAVIATAPLAANLPDLDVLLMVFSPLGHIRYHRGLTHSLPFALLLAGLLAYLASRRWPGSRMGALFGWNLGAVVGGHLLADWVTGFGTKLLLPLSTRRLALDWIALTEPLLVVPLLVLLVAAWRRPLRRRQLAIAALTLSVLVIGWRGWLHGRIRAEVAGSYAVPIHAVTLHPVDWRLKQYGYVVESSGRLNVGRAIAGRPPQELAEYAGPPAGDPVLAALKADPGGQAIFAFARHPLVTYERSEDGVRASIIDLRGPFGFRFRADLSPEMKVLRVWPVRRPDGFNSDG